MIGQRPGPQGARPGLPKGALRGIPGRRLHLLTPEREALEKPSRGEVDPPPSTAAQSRSLRVRRYVAAAPITIPEANAGARRLDLGASTSPSTSAAIGP